MRRRILAACLAAATLTLGDGAALAARRTRSETVIQHRRNRRKAIKRTAIGAAGGAAIGALAGGGKGAAIGAVAGGGAGYAYHRYKLHHHRLRLRHRRHYRYYRYRVR